MNSGFVRRELDRQLRSEPVLVRFSKPVGGWVRAVREALGMSQRDLGERLGRSQAAVAGYEQREQSDSLTVSTLAEVADALDCVLVYGLVPKSGTFQAVVEAQSRKIALQELAPITQTMNLEAQGLDSERLEEMLVDRADEIAGSRRLWKQQ